MSIFLRSARARCGVKGCLLFAIGELALIVFGIVLALRIERGLVVRSEREREAAVLRSLRTDLQKDLDSLDYQLDYRERRLAATRRLLAAIGGASLTAQELAVAVGLTLYEDRFTPADATVGSLLASGDLHRLPDAAIREGLSELQLLYRTNRSYLEHEQFEYREFVARPIYAHADLERIKPVFLGDKTADDVGLTQSDFAALLGDTTYKNGCVVAVWTSEEFVGLYRTLLQTTQRTADLIDVELAQWQPSGDQPEQELTLTLPAGR